MAMAKNGAPGEHNALHWIASGALAVRPDRITGSMDRYQKEFGIPEDYEQYSEGDLKSLKQQVEMELQDEDLQAFDALAEAKGFKQLLGVKNLDAGASAASAADGTASDGGIKTEAQILAAQIESLKMNVTCTLQKFQAQCTSLKVIKTKAEASQDVDMLVAFIKSLHAAIGKQHG